jgi:hypothetical protein
MINKFRRRIQGIVKIRIGSWSLIKSSKEQTKAQKIGPISIKVKISVRWFVGNKKGRSCDVKILKARWSTKCRNPNLGLATKVKACKNAEQEGDPADTSYAPGSAGERQRMSSHTLKWTPTWGVGVLMDSGIFKEWLQRSKPIELKSSLYHWKDIET